MTLFRYSEDRIPVTLFVALFMADIVVYATATSVWALSAWLLLVSFPKICICAWNHHHQHVPVFHNRLLNLGLELVYSYHTGITPHAWRLHHSLGHHLHYLDQSKDESAWKRPDGTPMGMLEYTFMVSVTAYPRAYRVGRGFPRYQREFVLAALFVAATLAVLLYFNWLNALFVFIVPMVVGLVVTVWHTYSHHAGLEADNHLEASHNITGAMYNLLSGNLGYHTAHHVKPGLHWSRLPELHRQIAPRIPPHLRYSRSLQREQRYQPAGKARPEQESRRAPKDEAGSADARTGAPALAQVTNSPASRHNRLTGR